MPVAAPLHNELAMDTSGAEKHVPTADRMPTLSHRMKHDKSILALAVSSQYIFAGTQGGEILVHMPRLLLWP
jgi:di- and tripeptidase